MLEQKKRIHPEAYIIYFFLKTQIHVSAEVETKKQKQTY